MSNIVIKGSNSIECLDCGHKWELLLPMDIRAVVKRMETIKNDHDVECRASCVKCRGTGVKLRDTNVDSKGVKCDHKGGL